MPAFNTLMFACFSSVSRAWSEPNESAFAMIPVPSVLISSEISLENSSVICSSVLSSVMTWTGIPGIISSFAVI